MVVITLKCMEWISMLNCPTKPAVYMLIDTKHQTVPEIADNARLLSGSVITNSAIRSHIYDTFEFNDWVTINRSKRPFIITQKSPHARICALRALEFMHRRNISTCEFVGSNRVDYYDNGVAKASLASLHGVRRPCDFTSDTVPATTIYMMRSRGILNEDFSPSEALRDFYATVLQPLIEDDYNFTPSNSISDMVKTAFSLR